jgi:hypothetical protein
VFVVAKLVPLAAAPYRASGLVLWPIAEVPPCPLSRRYQGRADIKRALTRGTPIYEYTP